MGFEPRAETTSLTRRFLLRAGVGAAATLACARVGRSADAKPRSDLPPDAAWGALRGRLRGRLLTVGDAEYASAKRVFDPDFDARMPAAVLEAATVDDVRSGLVFAREHGLAVAARAGGHSYVGASTTSDALVVDVRRLSEVAVDGDLVRIGAGATLFPVLRALDRIGRALPLGSCPTVGVAGLALGGGIGVDSRAHGMTCDRLVEADLVLPNGTVRTASETRAADLFWALRGAGAVGVVTSMAFRTHAATARDAVTLNFPGSARSITGWARWMPTADRSSWANLTVSAEGGETTCRVRLFCAKGAGETAAAELTAAVGLSASAKEVRTLSNLDTALVLAGGSDTTPRSTKVAGSDVVTDIAAVADTVLAHIAAGSRSGIPGYVILDPLDGAVRDLAPEATAFPWRRHAATLQWLVDSPTDPAAARRWVTDAHRALGAASAGAYANYVEPDTDPGRYFAGNLRRLRIIRRVVDPDNRLRTGLAL
ncbi:FAD-dependent oxidoreductase [Nocardia sp. NPDC050406]|uniref:FAD-dependent oxidoreductase n=1 Tax=Nocardia sp. NPDC050406 TaxID=3364318 RepID=UPI0037B3E0E3